MSINDDLSVFIADFGVPCSKAGITFLALFDQPDDIVGFHASDMISRTYSVTYMSSSILLISGDTIVVNGTSYKVQQAQQLDDGAFTQAVLKK